MASRGLLFLMLVSSSLLSSVHADAKKSVLSKGEIVRKAIGSVKDVGVPFLGLIPVHGTLVAAVTNLALGMILNTMKDKELLDVIKSEFESLHSKINEYHIEEKFTIWKAAIHKPELEIRVAWTNYVNLVKSLEGKNKEERQRLTEDFIKHYPKLAAQELHAYLTTKGTSLIDELGKMIQDHAKCHEDDIREYSLLINTLIHKGITMNHFYYQFNKIEFPETFSESAKIAYESASVMFQLQKTCMLNMDYIKEEVKKLIQNTKKRSELAHTVRAFLAKMYDRYDWMVVVYITSHSSHTIPEFLNKHTLTGFLAVPKDEVTVAIAKQVKGKHTKADKVKRAIERCRTQTVDCHRVAQALSECQEVVDNVEVSKTYSALHAYIDKAHQSIEAKEAPTEIYADRVDPTVPYVYTGICKKHKVSTFINMGGSFTVLIKSDQEMEKQDPCLELKCGGDERGACVRVENTFVAMCDCKPSYYGKNCEHNIKEYEKELGEKVEV